MKEKGINFKLNITTSLLYTSFKSILQLQKPVVAEFLKPHLRNKIKKHTKLYHIYTHNASKFIYKHGYLHTNKQSNSFHTFSHTALIAMTRNQRSESA